MHLKIVEQTIIPDEQEKEMWTTVIISIIIVMLIGGLAIAFARAWAPGCRVTTSEYAVVMTVVVLGAIFGLKPLVAHFSVAQQLNRQQFLNAVEVNAERSKPTKCYGGHSGSSSLAGQSNCSRTYISGSYSWTEQESYSCGTTEKPQTCYRLVTHSANIYTPYATREYDYTITYYVPGEEGEDQLKTYTVAHAVLDGEPTRYDSGVAIPADIPRGHPAAWWEARTRLDRGDPRPITILADYKNYVVASDNELLKEFGGDVEAYRKRGLLPSHTRNLSKEPSYNHKTAADKMSFIGSKGAYRPSDDKAWQEALAGLNAALGMELQGDMHIVAVDTDVVSEAERVKYTRALKAYWMSPAMGKRQIAKNGIIVVLGVNRSNATVQWAEASTGMPFGNETMLNAIKLRLSDGKTAFTPEALLGNRVTRITLDKQWKTTVTTTSIPPAGVLEKIVFQDFPFKRACMMCEDEQEAGETGYVYLSAEIQPTTGAKWIFAILTIIFSLFLWGFVATKDLEGITRRTISGTTRPSSRYYS